MTHMEGPLGKDFQVGNNIFFSELNPQLIS